MKNRFVLIAAAALSMVWTLQSAAEPMSGKWRFVESKGWYYQLEDGTIPTGWTWIADGYGKEYCYYLGNDGYFWADTMTPDGYYVDKQGRWVVNGIVQERTYELTKPRNQFLVDEGGTRYCDLLGNYLRDYYLAYDLNGDGKREYIYFDADGYLVKNQNVHMDYFGSGYDFVAADNGALTNIRTGHLFQEGANYTRVEHTDAGIRFIDAMDEYVRGPGLIHYDFDGDGHGELYYLNEQGYLVVNQPFTLYFGDNKRPVQCETDSSGLVSFKGLSDSELRSFILTGSLDYSIPSGWSVYAAFHDTEVAPVHCLRYVPAE